MFGTARSDYEGTQCCVIVERSPGGGVEEQNMDRFICVRLWWSGGTPIVS